MPYASSDSPLSPGVTITPGSVVVRPRPSLLWRLLLFLVLVSIGLLAAAWYIVATTAFVPGAQRALVLSLAGGGLFVAGLTGVASLDVLFGEYCLWSDAVSMHYEHRIAGVTARRLDTPASAGWQFMPTHGPLWHAGWCLVRSDSNAWKLVFGDYLRLTAKDIERIAGALRAPRTPVVSRVEPRHRAGGVR